MKRCTCVYRQSRIAERDEGAGPLIRELADPFCAATQIHERNAHPKGAQK